MKRRQYMRSVEPVVLIGIGGMLGATLRYLIGASAGGALPATLAVNAFGSFALGLLLFDARAAAVLSERSRYLFGTGCCASFTTYSTFIVDIVTTSPAVALAYVLGSYGAGFGAILASRATIEAVGATPITPPVPEGD